MSAIADIRLRTWNVETHLPVEVPLLFSGAVAAAELRVIPGAEGVHVVLSDATGVMLRAEVVAGAGELVPIRIERDEGGTLYLSSRGREVLHLPRDARYDPAPPIRPLPPPAALDVAIVVDGTTRTWPQEAAESGRPRRLLETKELWAEHVEKLVDFVTRISDGGDSRVAVIAFGDQEPPAVTARDLHPRYRLYPAGDERSLQPLERERLRERLLALPASPGADFVDAAADALDACTHLRWNEDVRKLVILTGDSPGASLLHPLPKGADLGVRQYDVDTRALALHRQGVELLTLYHAPARDSALYNIPFQRDLLVAARTQYARLASLRELAFDAHSFDPAVAADRFRSSTGCIGRGAALGELVRAAGNGSGSRSATGAGATPARHRPVRGR